MGFFSQLEQYASSHHRHPAPATEPIMRQRGECAGRATRNRPGDRSQATVTGEASHEITPSRDGLTGDRHTGPQGG